MNANGMACFHCLMPSTAELRIDKKNRPYTMCRWCNTRSFMPTREALWGIVVYEPQLRQMVAGLTRTDLHQMVLQSNHPTNQPDYGLKAAS
jgi:hypothetical protein